MVHPIVALVTAAVAIAVLAPAAGAQSERLDLPVVAIDAPNGIVDNPKRDGTMRVYDRQRRVDDSGFIGIELRGFSSQRVPKKSYALETREPSGANRDVSLLGMPADDDWILLANPRDESLLRNYVVYATSRWLGRWAPRTRLVEVVLNGSYEGVYLLAEDLKLHEKRVAVDDSDISGGYVLEMISFEQGRTEGRQFFTTPVKRQPIRYVDPSRDDLSLGRAAWIRDYVNRFERTLYGDRFRSRRRGYRRYLDMGAAVDYMLLNECFRNSDTFLYSTYMHKGVGGKLVLGPLWDFDHAAGNTPGPRGQPLAQNAVEGWQFGASPWAGRLYAHSAFRRRMAERWEEMRAKGLRRQIMRTIDSGAGQLAGGPQERNYSRHAVFGTDKAYPNDPRTGAPPANYAQAVDYLKWWVGERIKWIDGHVNSLRPR